MKDKCSANLIRNEHEYGRVNRKFKLCSWEIIRLCDRQHKSASVQLQLERLEQQKQIYQSMLEQYLLLVRRDVPPPSPGDITQLPLELIRTRIYLGWTQGHLAELVGCTKQQIQRWEAANYLNANFASIIKIADVLADGLKHLLENNRKK